MFDRILHRPLLTTRTNSPNSFVYDQILSGVSHKINSFNDEGLCHIETSPLICSANHEILVYEKVKLKSCVLVNSKKNFFFWYFIAANKGF